MCRSGFVILETDDERTGKNIPDRDTVHGSKKLVVHQEKRGVEFIHVQDVRPSSDNAFWAVGDVSPHSGDATCYVEHGGNRRYCYLEGYLEKVPIDQELMDYMDEIDNGPGSNIYDAIGPIDHAAYRVHDRDIIDTARDFFIRTGYRFSESYLVEDQHAKTVVFRRGDTLPAIVASFGFAHDSVVSRYVAAFGPRVPHTAFSCDDIRATVTSQKHDGILFTTDQVVGDEHKGLLQIFTKPSAYSGGNF